MANPEDQVAELALRRGRIAQRRCQIIPEDDADADAGAAHPDAGNASPNVFRGGRIHEEAPFNAPAQSSRASGRGEGGVAVSGLGVSHR